MKRKLCIAATCAAIVLSPLSTTGVSAKSFKAKYYKECYADMKEMAKLVKPKKSMQEKTKKASGLFGAIGSLAGVAGVGGGAFKAASTINKINKYSGMIDNVTAFSDQMSTDYPDANDRFAAYGNHMSEDASNLMKVQTAINNSQTCYNTAYDTVIAERDAGTMKKKKAKKRLKEIRKGSIATGDVLMNAMNHINKNLNSYDQVLGGEQSALSSGMGGLASKFLGGRGVAIASATGASAAGITRVAGDNRSADSYRYMHVQGMQAGTKASLISNLAGLASLQGQNQNEGVQSGVYAVAKSSEEYLVLHNSYMATVDTQRQLETKVKQSQ